MPKMPEAFYAQKREEILDAAQRIALEKPLSHVSMKDLIRACGVSQGAIYHYFSGLDEIWLGLIQRFYDADDVLAHLRALFLQPLSPQETICLCLRELCENLRRTIPLYGKLIMELNTLVQANPAQYRSLAGSQDTHNRLDEMLSLFDNWCHTQAKQGAMHPRVSREQLCLHLSSTYLGLRYHAAALHLQPSFSENSLDAYLDLQLPTWQRTILYLLGLEATDETTSDNANGNPNKVSTETT